jgi:hypothetical protein
MRPLKTGSSFKIENYYCLLKTAAKYSIPNHKSIHQQFQLFFMTKDIIIAVITLLLGGVLGGLIQAVTITKKKFCLSSGQSVLKNIKPFGK